MRRIVMGIAVLGLAACGGHSSKGSGGTVGNPPPAATMTVTGRLPLTATNFAVVNGGASCQAQGLTYGIAYAAMIASDQGGICGFLQANQNKASARSVNLAVVKIDPTSSTATITTGAYPVVANPSVETAYAFVQVSQNDASCKPDDVSATGGTVNVTAADGNHFQGTLDVTLSDGGKITGSFDAPACAVTFPGNVCTGDIGPVNPTCTP